MDEPDVSVLFDAVETARAAWSPEDATHALGFLREEAMPLDKLDTRLVQPFSPGAAFIGIKLGATDQLKVRTMLTNPETGETAYPDPWAATALQRVASKLIIRLLDAGGKAVVLHKAGGVVKSAAQFRSELGDPNDLERRPFLAWLDLMACDDGEGGVICRSFGMPHYFGAPNVRAGMPTADSQAIECSMQAVHYTWYPAIEWDASYNEEELFIDLTAPSY